MKAKVQNFLATSFTNNSEGIGKANRTLTDIMLDTAKHTYKKTKKYKTTYKKTKNIKLISQKNRLTRNVRQQEKCLKRLQIMQIETC